MTRVLRHCSHDFQHRQSTGNNCVPFFPFHILTDDFQKRPKATHIPSIAQIAILHLLQFHLQSMLRHYGLHQPSNVGNLFRTNRRQCANFRHGMFLSFNFEDQIINLKRNDDNAVVAAIVGRNGGCGPDDAFADSGNAKVATHGAFGFDSGGQCTDAVLRGFRVRKVDGNRPSGKLVDGVDGVLCGPVTTEAIVDGQKLFWRKPVVSFCNGIKITCFYSAGIFVTLPVTWLGFLKFIHVNTCVESARYFTILWRIANRTERLSKLKPIFLCHFVPIESQWKLTKNKTDER